MKKKKKKAAPKKRPAPKRGATSGRITSTIKKKMALDLINPPGGRGG